MGGQMLSTTLARRCNRVATSSRSNSMPHTRVTQMSTFHDFEMTSITGDSVSFDRFEDQICLIVNVASG